MDRRLVIGCFLLSSLLAIFVAHLSGQVAAPPAPAAGAQGAAEPPAEPTTEKILWDFEGPPWKWKEEEKEVAVEANEHAHGKQWLRITMFHGFSRGMRYTFQPQDWSAYRAFRFFAWNPGEEDALLSVRFDDAESNDKYALRYNLNDEVRVKPGANEVEITLASLRLGTQGSRGLDLKSIVIFAPFFITPPKPVTVCLDDVRLVPRGKTEGDELLLADFDGRGTAKWRNWRASTFQVEERPDGVDGAALAVNFPAGQQYPGVELFGMEGNWLNYDMLCMDVLCPEDRATPRHIFFNVKGSDGTQAWLCTGLEKGLNHLRAPLELAGFASLGRVSELDVFTDFAAEKEETVFLDNVRLERRAGYVVGEPVHRDGVVGRIRVDLRELAPDDENASFGAVAWVPLATGGVRSVHCTAPPGAEVEYGIGTDSLVGMKANSPVEVWGYIRAKNCLYWTHDEATPKGEEPVTVNFDDLVRFGY